MPVPAASVTTCAGLADGLPAVIGGFLKALQNARAEGRLTDDALVDELAAFLTVRVTGMLLLIRSGSDPAYLRASLTQALERLRQFAR